jgi:hypothetical protein
LSDDDPDLPILTLTQYFSIVHEQSDTAIDEASWHVEWQAWLRPDSARLNEGPDGAVVEENGDVI